MLQCLSIYSLFFVTQGYIEAQEEGFDKFFKSGQELVDAEHYAADEIKEKVSKFGAVSPYGYRGLRW